MSRYQLLGVADDAQGIADVLNSRRQQLGLTILEMNELTGLTGGYVNKIFARNYKKQLGNLSLPVFLKTLGCRIVIVADDESIPAITRRALNEKTLTAAKCERLACRGKSVGLA